MKKTASRNNTVYYPAFLNLNGARCVVFGGGIVAERKVGGLLDAGANVTVISLDITHGLKRLFQKDRIKYINRSFRPDDFMGVFLAVAATDNEKINEIISQTAIKYGTPINVVDRPALSNFIVPSVMRRGPLCIAVSTSGASPAMAAVIRRDMERTYGPAFGDYLKKLRGLRADAMKAIKDPKKRAAYLKSLASKDIVNKLKKAKNQ